MELAKSEHAALREALDKAMHDAANAREGGSDELVRAMEERDAAVRERDEVQLQAITHFRYRRGYGEVALDGIGAGGTDLLPLMATQLRLGERVLASESYSLVSLIGRVGCIPD
jgi:hypothetical protein